MISIISMRGGDKMKCILERFGWAKQTAFTLVSSVVSIIIVAPIAVPAESKIEIAKLPPPITAHVDFAKDIKPLFENVCLKCHGPEHPSGAFRLDTREGALRGGQNG